MRHGRVDYRMARRATVRDVREGMRSRQDVCDAHPDLVRAGRHIGTRIDEDCPVCSQADLTHVTYIFPHYSRKARSGQAVPRDSLAAQVQRLGDCAVYTVEVCLSCHWHHLVEKFELTPRGRAVGG